MLKNVNCISKKFDYYYILCIINHDNPENQMNLKLPLKFVEKYKENLKELLNEFLKIVGINHGQDKEKIIEFSHIEKIMALNPTTLHDTHFFGCQHEDKTYCFFGIQQSKHAKMLKEYEVRK